MATKAAALSPELVKAGFVSTLPKTRRRLILATDGHEKTGKTRFALTAPGPIVFINFDYGLEGPLLEEFGHKIAAIKSFGAQSESFNLPTQKESQEVWDDVCNAYLQAMKSGMRTVVVDTYSDAYNWARLAYFGKFSQVMPNHYMDLNDITKRMIMQAHKYDSNVIFIHRQKEDWKDNKPTGVFKREGSKHMGYAVHCNATHTRKLVTDGSGKVNKWGLTITDARQNMDLAGVELEDEQVTFPYLAEMVFPKTTEKDWQ